MANEKTPVVWDDTTKKHRPLGTGEKMGGLDASSLLSSDSGNLLEAGSDGLAYLSGSGMVDPRADNLLEDSANGKLQVTIDRIAEWLDGHPQDAAALADAINVVSGDSGNVIVEGTDKGAFLSKGAISAAVAGMTDAQKAQLADAIAARIASDIADGKTIVASGGKLTSDPTNATAAQKKAINQALADADSGLVVDNATGKLTVDFSQMPTDKFEDLLKSLDMQIPLRAPLTLIVDQSSEAASDVIEDGRGAEWKPFKTIGACVSYVASTFALGNYSVYIRVKSGVYSESIILSDLNHARGYVVIQAYDYDNPPTVVNSVQGGAIFSAIGGHWALRRLAIYGTYSYTGETVLPSSVLISVSNDALLDLYGCDLSCSYVGAADTAGRMLRCVAAGSGAKINLIPMETYANSFTFQKGNSSNLSVFYLERGSEVTIHSSNNASDVVSFPCSGDCSAFARVALQSRFAINYGGLYDCVFSGPNVTGIQYTITDGSGVFAPTGGFPGESSGSSVESSTYSWYKQYGV